MKRQFGNTKAKKVDAWRQLFLLFEYFQQLQSASFAMLQVK